VSPSLLQNAPSLLQNAWANIDVVTTVICEDSNVRSRVLRISREYARLFSQNHRLYWSGVAAFAANEVRRTLALWRMIIGPSSLLSSANKLVFQEFYPPLACFQRTRAQVNNGNLLIDAVIDSMADREVATEICKAIREIHNNHLEAGAKRILFFEQHERLQREFYSKWRIAFSTQVNHMLRNLLLPIRLRFCYSCKTTNGNLTVELQPQYGSIHKFSNRWPFAESALDRFIEIINTLGGADRRFLLRELRKIINT
jgi:hypothetical protein